MTDTERPTPAQQARWNAMSDDLVERMDQIAESLLTDLALLHGETADDEQWRRVAGEQLAEAIGTILVSPGAYGIDLQSELSERYWLRHYEQG